MKKISNASLKTYNTFSIEGFARELIVIEAKEDLPILYQNSEFGKPNQLIIGGGSNILLTQPEIDSVIIVDIKGIEIVKRDQEFSWVLAGGGEIWDQVVQFAVNHKLGGIENLSIIPGKVGAAPIQNIGAYGAELKDVFDNLTAFNLQTGELESFEFSKCEFGYRNSFFKKEGKGKFIITDITLKLQNNPIFNTTYGALNATLDSMGVKEPSVGAIRSAVIKIRTSKLPDPEKIGNAGSFFKNPVIDTSLFESLKADYPEMPGYPQEDDEQTKIAAGWLIEKCGWKGKRIGDAGVHEKQALVLVNYGKATGEDIEKLALQIQSSVIDTFGIILEPEVNII